MTAVTILTGLFMIFLGYLVKKFPNLIAGYNTMSKAQKEKVDIEGLSSFMRDSFITIGVVMIIAYLVFQSLGWDRIANSVILFTTLAGVTIMIIKAQKYDHN